MVTIDFNNFPFLKQRFSRGFFSKYLNSYFLYLFELSNRLNLDHEEVVDAFLSMLYTNQLEVFNRYTFSFLQRLIYGNNDKKGELEMGLLDSEKNFILAFVHNFLITKSFEKQRIQQELYREAGLLVVSERPQLRRMRQPAILATNSKSIYFCTVHKLNTSVIQYKQDCEYATERLEVIKPFGRSYISITKEFTSYLDEFLHNHKKFLTAGLSNSVKQAYNIYRIGISKPVSPSIS